jgi:Yip1 domain
MLALLPNPMEQPPSLSEVQSAAPKPPAMSLAARMMNIFAAPAEVFEDIKNSPPSTANWLVPAVVLVVIGWICSGIVLSQDAFRHQISDFVEKTVEKQIEKLHLSEEQANLQRKGQEIGWKINAVAGPALIAFATPFIWGLFLWLVGRKAFKANLPFMKGVEIAGLASMIGILEAVVKTLLIFVTGNIMASTSLALLVKDFNPQNPTHAVFAIVNVMTFWVLVIRAIGLARVTNVTTGRAIAWVFSIWISYTAFFWGLGMAVQHIFEKK